VEVTGGTTNFTQDSFATTLFTGTGSAETVNNGLDLAGDGGLVWLKARSTSGYNHTLYDTERSGTLFSDSTNAASDYASEIASYNNNGFTTVSSGAAYNNVSGVDYVSWSFKKQAKFFDIVTWTGDGTNNRAISHNLGGSVGTLIIKVTSVSDSWLVWHKDLADGEALTLNTTNSAAGYSSSIPQDPTDASFFVSSNVKANRSGETYIAYLFAHDTASDSRIKCGSYTGNGSTTGDFEDLGWQPQWIMVKVSSSTDGWILLDSVRGVTGGNDPRLEANTSGSEANGQIMEFSSTGFTPLTADGKINGSGKTYIYMAIRGDGATDSAITWPSSVKWPSGVAPTTPAPGTKDLFTFLTTDGGTTYYGKKAAEGLA
jgi:hypothetical protein